MRIIPPNVFSKQQIPKTLPKDVQKIVEKLKKTKTKMACLKIAYNEVGKKFHGEIFRVVTHFFHLYTGSFAKIWSKPGWLHCNTLNYLLRVLLVKSGKFKDSEIKVKWTMVYYISLHQYFRIKMDKNKYLNVDMWGRNHKIPLGAYSHGFYKPDLIFD